MKALPDWRRWPGGRIGLRRRRKTDRPPWYWERLEDPYEELERLGIEDPTDEFWDRWYCIEDLVNRAVAEGRFDDALALVGNQCRHEVLADWWVRGILRPAELAEVILDAWDHGRTNHLDALGKGLWLEMFRATGFVASPWRAKPTESLVVYRGQPVEAPEVGMSWSSNRSQAEWFRNRWEQYFRVPATVLTAIAPPEAVLALSDQRKEAEVIVDPDLLVWPDGDASVGI